MTASKQEQAYRAVRKRILEGTLRPGSRLVADGLARELRISPVPVREALRRLEAEGFIEYERNVGARIRTLDPGSWAETLEAVAALDGYATRLALDYIRPGDLKKAREANRRMKRAIRDAGPEQVKRANQEVHAPLTGRCPNAYVRELLQAAWARLYISELGSVFLYRPEQAERQVGDHEAIISMIEAGADPDEVEEAVRRHTLDLIAALAEDEDVRLRDERKSRTW